ncbi:hypothetical protein ES288_D01G098800v1 [Gossypium darwinii]|uniref:Uncharacterized protein n=1 Tax=Gossypium darwinii TaxID=34276 RepID=A0A5D2DNF8_GOSDA|nr:hypothetical protein ES288_D01G098800v1 [Gossypium darwinii]
MHQMERKWSSSLLNPTNDDDNKTLKKNSFQTSNAFICIIYKKKNKYRETKQQTMKLGDLGKQNHPPKPEKKL